MNPEVAFALSMVLLAAVQIGTATALPREWWNAHTVFFSAAWVGLILLAAAKA